MERLKRCVANNFITEVEEACGSTARTACHTKAKLVEAKLEMVRAVGLFQPGPDVSSVRWINTRDRLQRHEIDGRLQRSVVACQGKPCCDRSSRFTHQGWVPAL